MKPVTTPTAPKRVPLRRDHAAEWRERSAILYEQLARPARAMVRRAFRGAFCPDELDDIYAAAWVGVLRALERRHAQLSDDEVRSYVFTAVANQAGKELRRRGRKPTAPLELAATTADPASTPEDRAVASESSRLTRDLLSTLPPRRRAVMLLRYGWGLEPKQVCGLIDGLSPRAYRKEVTRGVDELAERIRSVERGEWCAEREPVLKAFAAGAASAEQELQAQAHLSHCRGCSEFVARLSGHLHDLSGAAIGSTAIDGLGGHVSLVDRAADLAERAREAVAGALARGSNAAEEAAASVASTGAGARGAGAAGAGVLTKLAGVGSAGKLALTCIGAGAAATACVAAAVGPLNLADRAKEPDLRSSQERVEPNADRPPSAPQVPVPSDVPSRPAADGHQSDGRDGEAEAPTQPSQPVATEAPPPASDPVAASAPPVQQEFGVAASAAPPPPPAAAPTTSSSRSGGGGSAVQQEFGP